MSKFSLSTTLVASLLVAPAFAQSAGDAPLALISSFAPDPYFDLVVIDRDFNSNVVSAIHSAEAVHIGNGQYYVSLCANISAGQTHLITGVLDMTVPPTPAAWTPNDDVGLVNMPGTGAVSQFQLSISPDLLVICWDSYSVVTYNSSAGPQTGNTFVCTRTSTSAQFQVADVRAVTNVAGGGIDPSMGIQMPNGNYWLFGIDFLNVAGAINAWELDPATGTATFTNQVINYTSSGFSGFYHSPRVLWDSTGKPRALIYSDYAGSGFSNWVFNRSRNGAATSEILIDGSTNGYFAGNTWCNNPPVVGGRLTVCTDGANGQHVAETVINVDAETDANGDLRFNAWAPTDPGATGPVWGTWVGLGLFTPIPIPISGVLLGNLHCTADIIVGPITHDPNTGFGELVLTGLPFPKVGAQYVSQSASLNFTSGAVILSNTATVDV